MPCTRHKLSLDSPVLEKHARSPNLLASTKRYEFNFVSFTIICRPLHHSALLKTSSIVCLFNYLGCLSSTITPMAEFKAQITHHQGR